MPHPIWATPHPKDVRFYCDHVSLTRILEYKTLDFPVPIEDHLYLIPSNLGCGNTIHIKGNILEEAHTLLLSSYLAPTPSPSQRLLQLSLNLSSLFVAGTACLQAEGREAEGEEKKMKTIKRGTLPIYSL